MASVARVGTLARGIPLAVTDDVPFPCEIRRHFVAPGLLAAARVEWPDMHSPAWVRYADDHSNKYASRGWAGIGRAGQWILQRMAEFSSPLIGVAWPDLELHGAGLHVIPPGGHLSLHLDAAVHPVTGWRRVASGVLFLDDWREEWGGALSLGAKAERRIYPEAGKLAVFACGENAWHAVERVTGPSPRRTLALFWWGPPDSDSSTRDKAEFKCCN